MRLLLTTDTVGGVWTFTKQLAECLLREGHAVALVSFGARPMPTQQAWCERMRRTWGIRFFFEASTDPLEWMQNNGGVFERGEELLLRVAEQFEAELLHTSQFCWGALRGSLPRVVTVHSDVLSWAAACKPDVLQGSPWLSRYVDLVQRGVDGADMLVSPTRWMQTAFARGFRVHVPQQVIANGRTVAVPERPRRVQAVSAGRLWDEAKGVHVLTEVDVAMPIVLAGEAAFGESMVAPRNVQVAGALEEGDLFALFAASSVYVATSLYEPFGLAPLEAALCGCAVVARDIASLREVWADGALYFDSARELERLLQRLASDGEALKAAETRSHLRANLYTADRMAQAYLNLYRSVLRTRTEGRSHAA